MPLTCHQGVTGLAEAEARCLPGGCPGHATAVSRSGVLVCPDWPGLTLHLSLSVWPWLVSVLNSFQPKEDMTSSAGMTS